LKKVYTVMHGQKNVKLCSRLYFWNYRCCIGVEGKYPSV